MKTLAVFFSVGLVSISLFAAECTSRWNTFLETDPLNPKPFSGDTVAGYAVFSFTGDKRIQFKLKGKFPKARFFSLESQDTRLSISQDALFDSEIEPDTGSENPYREGVALDTKNREYTLTVSQTVDPKATNTLKLPSSILQHSIMLRIYSPNLGVTLTKEDLPRVFAFDARTGAEVSCPRPSHYPVYFYFPQFFASIYAFLKPEFKFSVAGESDLAGLNKAAGYSYAVSNLKRDDVAIIRFRAPRFVNTQSGIGVFHPGEDVRYWSFCTNNFPKNITLNCLPDFQATSLKDWVTIVVGSPAVRAEALKRGYNYLPDSREPNQKVMSFLYRNLVPSEAFRAQGMYQGEYLPQAQKCSESDFLRGNCH